MARDGYLILDSDLHMMEPDDLWARYLDGPHGPTRPPSSAASASSWPKPRRQGQHRHDHGHGGAGPGDPGAQHAARGDRLQPRIAAPQPCPPPAFQCRPGARLRSRLDADRNGYGGHRCRRDVRHPRPARSCAMTIWRPITPQRSRGPTTTGPPIIARPTRSGSNSPRRSRCTTSSRPSRKPGAR